MLQKVIVRSGNKSKMLCQKLLRKKFDEIELAKIEDGFLNQMKILKLTSHTTATLFLAQNL